MIVHDSVREGFLSSGFNPRHYFDHRVVELTKKYPDTLLVMEKRGLSRIEMEDALFLQVNVYADDVAEFPDALFFDHQINWHHQQFGIKGLIGAAGLYLSGGGALFVTLMQSDLMQQIYRAKELRKYKSRLENRFKSWARMTLSAILGCAARRGITTVYIPTSATITSLLAKDVDPALFQRIYDFPARALSADKHAHGGHDYWRIVLSPALVGRIGEYASVPSTAPHRRRRQVCILHDIEEDVDTPVPPSTCSEHLDKMLAVEKQRAVLGTYNVLGRILPKVKSRIEHDGHDIGFHSYNHDIKDLRQLPQARQMDPQIKGYRPPQSRITEELTPYGLSYWNFEWFASSAHSFGRDRCYAENGVAHIPIHIDDYALHTGEMNFIQWRDCVLAGIRERDFCAFSLHDCYAAHWIEHYGELLDAILELAELKTCDQIAGQLFMTAE